MNVLELAEKKKGYSGVMFEVVLVILLLLRAGSDNRMNLNISSVIILMFSSTWDSSIIRNWNGSIIIIKARREIVRD